MIVSESNVRVMNALDIPYVTADEAHILLRSEFGRFMALLDTLQADDWHQATACTAWSVRDIVAHQAGGYATGTGYREMFHQMLARPKTGGLVEDELNAFQLVEREGRSPQELVAELRRVGPVAVQKWAYRFRFARLFGLPHPVPGWLSIRYLMWVIHSRDTWMHRLDICRATGRHFEQTPGHDGRIVALVIRDVGRQLSRKVKGKGIVLELTGISGGVWQVGRGEEAARVQMDALDFNVFASGRFAFEEARGKMEISGDQELAEEALKGLLVLY